MLLCVVCGLLAGCGVTRLPGMSAASLHFSGKVHGGQQPLQGAAIQLYAVGTSGDSSDATPLLATPAQTDANGQFNFDNFVCPSADANVFLVARGGNPGLSSGSTNAAVTMMTALGPCGLLTDATYVQVNEVTTVAAVNALAPFMQSYLAIGASAAHAALLNAAFQRAALLANVATGTAPGASLPPGISVPVSKILTLADILSSCINSAGGVAGDGSKCGNLFLLGSATGGASAPTETAGALLGIAMNPLRNVVPIFLLCPALSPFQPTLSNAPADWTIAATSSVPAPVFSPAPGSFTGSFEVAISDGDASAQIFYTTDGSEPTPASTLYTGGPALSAAGTLRAIAVDAGRESVETDGAYATAATPTTGATALSFVVQPSNESAGYSIAPAVEVIPVDAHGTPMTTTAVPVTLTLQGTASAVLTGTLTAQSGSTPATFASLSVSTPGTYTLVASSPGLTSAVSASFTVRAFSAGSSTYYVSNTGNDANAGTSQAAPWRSLAKVNAAALIAGSQVLLQTGGVWHEELLPRAGVRYSYYGAQQPSCTEDAALVPHCANFPIIDGADAVTGWVSYGPTAFRAPYTSVASKGFVDALYQQTTPLTLVPSAAAVAATPGSIFSDGTYVYVHLLDGSAPGTHTVEVSGSRPYGIFINGPSNVTVDGLEVIRAARSGYLNYAFTGTGSSNIVENSVFFNNGDALGDVSLGGAIEGAILSVAGYLQAPVPGFVASNNEVGRMDVPHNLLNYAWAGIQASGMAGAQIIGNKVATVNGWAVRIQDWFANSCTAPLLSGNETANSEGNLAVAGCPNGVVTLNYIHDSLGNAVQGGAGLLLTNVDTGLMLSYNRMENLRSAYNSGLYNGFDMNYVANGTAIGNTCVNVAASCMTLEADSAPSGNWVVKGNSFDASQNVYIDGAAASSSKRVYPFYIRDTSLAAGLTMQQNKLVVNVGSPYVKYGATSASDLSHDITMPTFEVVCPNCAVGP